MKKSIILADGTKIYYWCYHDPKLPIIVLIHGFTGSHKGFQYLEPLLGDFHLIIPDLPGSGASDLPKQSDWDIAGLARLANEFVTQLNLKSQPHIIGHSMGGLVVSAMVSQLPNLYADVILISPVPTAVSRRDSRRIGANLGALQYRIGHKLGKTGQKLVTSRTISAIATSVLTTTKSRQLKKDIRQHHWDNLENISSIKFYELLHRDINKRGAIDFASALAQKRLALIVGDVDNVTPLVEEKKLAAAIHPEMFEIIKGVGHLIHYEQAKTAARLIKAFLSRHQSNG